MFNFSNYYAIFQLDRSAFFWYCNDERSKVKAVNPEYGVGDIAKELGRRWSDVDPEVKSKYEAMADKDKARYERVSIILIIASNTFHNCRLEKIISSKLEYFNNEIQN